MIRRLTAIDGRTVFIRTTAVVTIGTAVEQTPPGIIPKVVGSSIIIPGAPPCFVRESPEEVAEMIVAAEGLKPDGQLTN